MGILRGILVLIVLNVSPAFAYNSIEFPVKFGGWAEQSSVFFVRPNRESQESNDAKIHTGFRLTSSYTNGHSSNISEMSDRIASSYQNLSAVAGYYLPSKSHRYASFVVGKFRNDYSVGGRYKKNNTFIRANAGFRLGYRSRLKVAALSSSMTQRINSDNIKFGERPDQAELNSVRVDYSIGREKARGFLNITGEVIEYDFSNNDDSGSSDRLNALKRTSTSVTSYLRYRKSSRSKLEALFSFTDFSYKESKDSSYQLYKFLVGAAGKPYDNLELSAITGLAFRDYNTYDKLIWSSRASAFWRYSPKVVTALNLSDYFDDGGTSGRSSSVKGVNLMLSVSRTPKIWFGGALAYSKVKSDTTNTIQSAAEIAASYRYSKNFSLSVKYKYLNNYAGRVSDVFDDSVISVSAGLVSDFGGL